MAKMRECQKNELVRRERERKRERERELVNVYERGRERGR